MPRDSQANAIERRLSEAEDGGDRYVDLQLDLVAANDEELLGGGGIWDRRHSAWVGDAERGRTLKCHPGQEPPARFFAEWLDRWWRHRFGGEPIPDHERIYSLILAGGQRSGKTWLGVFFAVLYAVTVPGSIVWIVCPTELDFEEVEDYLRDLMPREWYERLGFPWWRYTLANGSKIVLRSGHRPESLKKGDCDLIVINEAQQQKEKVFNIARLRIARSGAMVIVCANPPDEEVGDWLADRVAAAERGDIQAVYFHIDPFDNPHIDHGPMLAFAKEVDQRTLDIEVRGKFLGAKHAVWPDWSRLENEKPTPAAELDVTGAFLLSQEGRAYDQVVGIDIQKRPMVGAEFRWFRNPLVPDELDEWWRWQLMWLTREFYLDRSDEDGLSLAMLEAGLDPERTLLVVDASGEWQKIKKSDGGRVRMEFKNETYKGRGSWDVFRDHGFHHIVKPDRKQDANPDVVERCRAAAQRICLAAPGPYGQRFVFSDPRNRKMNEAIRGYPNKKGVPARQHKYAHPADAFSYPINRWYPRRRLVEPEIRVVKKLEGRGRMQGW